MPEYVITVTWQTNTIDIDTDSDYPHGELEGVDPNSLKEMSDFLEAAVLDGEIDLEPEVAEVAVRKA